MIIKNTGSFKLISDSTELIVDSKGGRITSFKCGEKEFLAGQNINPALFGSTLWPSPQSIWNWPPPAMLDEKEYTYKINDDKLVLISADDKNLGMRFTKEFSVCNNAILILYSIKNISFKSYKVSPWEVTRVNKGGIAFFPKGKNDSWGMNLNLMKVYNKNNIIWYESEVKIYNDHTKLFNNGSEGWLAFIQDGYIFIKKFEEITAGLTAPNEDGIEIYANPTDNYIELENQGNYIELQPGEEINYEVNWYAEKLDKKVSIDIGNIELVEYTRRILKETN